MKEGVPLAIEDILYDPQTAGGLLISLPETEGLRLVSELEGAAEIIGWAEELHDYSIVVK